MTKRMTWITVLLIALVVACGSDGNEATSGGPSGSASGGSGGGGGMTNGPGAGGSAAGGFNPTGGSNGSGGNMGCLTSESEGTQSPLDIVVLLDRSSSMAGPVWDGTVNALTSFFNNPGGSDISAALNYFPPADNSAQCQPASYDPPDVAITDLATNASVLVNDIQGASPQGDETPTWAALFGTLLFANAHQDANSDHVVIVVLASDGDPTACNTNVMDISSLASTALAYNGVRTFVIAIQGATVANLDQIAAAGGTMQAYDVTSDITQFKQKMDEIRAEVLACEYIIPEPENGQDFDPTKLNVTYTPGGSGTPQDIPQAEDLNDCAGGEGWYYDNPSAPTKILFCPATCQTVQQDGMAKVTFVFGCPTIVN